MKRIKSLAAAVLLVCVLVCGCVSALASEALTPDQASNSVFRVAVKDAGGAVTSFGSAFGVGESAPLSYLLTNYHVISDNLDGVYIWVGKNTEIPCSVAVSVPEKDIAVLKLATPIDEDPLPIGAEGMAKMGDEVFALGYPTNDISNTITSYASDVSASKGIISKMSVWNDVLYYQIDAALNQGNSGGPLLHENGYVVGIATMKMNDTEGINGAIRIEEAMDALSSLGVSVKLATLTTSTETPGATTAPTATPSPTPTATPFVTPAIVQVEESGSSLWSTVWLVVFILAAVAFVAVLVYMIVKAKMDGKSPVSAFLPEKEKPEPVQEERIRGYLIGKRGTYAGAVIALDGETVFCGRDPQRCQLVFEAEERRVSRVHCSIRYDEKTDLFTLENYSANGTYLVHGGRLGEGDAADLRSGDQFYIVDESCLFEVQRYAPDEKKEERDH